MQNQVSRKHGYETDLLGAYTTRRVPGEGVGMPTRSMNHNILREADARRSSVAGLLKMAAEMGNNVCHWDLQTDESILRSLSCVYSLQLSSHTRAAPGSTC